jgi:hypothetical protein
VGRIIVEDRNGERRESEKESGGGRGKENRNDILLIGRVKD